MVARGWAAPRLDYVAHALEEQLAPRISAMLSQAAERIDPMPRRPARRWPMVAIVAGAAMGAIGFALYRKSAQEWAESMKDTAHDATTWVNEKADRAKERAQHLGHHETGHKADEPARKTP
ncbi:hypothetical protein Ssi02_60920 [Sinosporangium siamense]|uniref:YtxH domain-containing protein n=1 Tax=Sinosporangium siamense TaxID=1367973 RepID=A0A919RP78_9ACTN|nr:hypothetical protein Ssi02_60920 [Sinosporangium siamense]